MYVSIKKFLCPMVCLMMAAGIFSCRKILDTQNLSAISGDQVWNSTATANDYLYNTYASVLTRGWTAGATVQGPTQIMEVDAYTLNNISYGAVYNGNNAPQIFGGTLNNNNNPDVGYDNFSQVFQCNTIISNVQSSSGISAADKVNLIAQAKFLRALCYYYEARAFGKIVWIDTLLSPKQDLRLPTVPTVAQSWKYVIRDLQDAVAGLPATSPTGLANKYVAEAFLSEACLEALAYAHYPDPPNVQPDDPLLELAVSSARDVITNGGYALDPNYGEMFNGTNPAASEILFSRTLNSINTQVQNTPILWLVINLNNSYIQQYDGSPSITVSTTFQAWGSANPTQNMADDYLVVDQQDPTTALPWYETSQFINSVTHSARPGTTDIPHNTGETDLSYGTVDPASGQTMWTLTNVGRDARWAASIISDSTELAGQTMTTCVKGNATRWMQIYQITKYNSITNLYWNKMVWPVSPGFFYTNPTNYSYPIMRLGRVYLNLAEAYLLQGNVADAVTAFNRTRVVHGQLPPSRAADLTAAWTDYKRERRVDLTLENDYYWSLLRWGLYGGEANHGNAPVGDIPELDSVPRVMDISKDRMKYVIVTGPFFSSNNVRHFDYPRRYLFPISYNKFILPNNNIVQNPGW
jgi:hypothetical protein